MPKLTKFDIAAIRKADALVIHLSKHNSDGLVRLIKHADRSVPFAQDQEHVLPAEVRLHGFRGQDELKAGTASFVAHASVYWNQKGHVESILKSIREGDEIRFKFYPDAHSNGYLAMSGLHADVLFLAIDREGKRIAEYELIVSACPSNSARMCRGLPDSESYRRTAIDARANAA
jgi:hypothetical protein